MQQKENDEIRNVQIPPHLPHFSFFYQNVIFLIKILTWQALDEHRNFYDHNNIRQPCPNNDILWKAYRGSCRNHYFPRSSSTFPREQLLVGKAYTPFA
jgi:hypothetical protein